MANYKVGDIVKRINYTDKVCPINIGDVGIIIKINTTYYVDVRFFKGIKWSCLECNLELVSDVSSIKEKSI